MKNDDENKNKKLKDNKTTEESRKLIVKKKEKSQNKFINIIKKKWLLKGVTTLLLIAIIIAIYIGVNIILKKITLPEFDSTENKVYSLSEETKTKLESLDKEVTITLINYSNNETIINFTEKYKALNSKIKIERIDDISSRKDIMEKYSIDTSTSLIVISNEKNETILSEYDLYTYDYSTYETIDTTEEAITNAIVEVTTEDKPKIYFMNNHVMYDVNTYYNTLITSMEEDANEVDTLDILISGSIPNDCDTLVITTLKEDITDFERDKIIEYINRGGKLLLLCGPNITGNELTNFEEILNQYAITIEDGVIFEGDTSNMLYGYPDFIIEGLEINSMTQNLRMNLNVCLADAASIIFDEERLEELGVEYEELAFTSDSAFIRTNLNQNTASRTYLDSEEGSFIVGAIATKRIDENNKSKLIIFSNELFVSDMQVQINGYQTQIINLYNNEDAVLNSIAYLNEREDTITIRKSYDTIQYTATEQQTKIIMAIIFITPLVIIIIGIIVWQCRRRKR